MSLRFTKMHGLGNDFVVIDAIDDDIELDRGQLIRLADRRRGVGCDQILKLSPCKRGAHAAHFRIFNSDGGEAEQCGNGMRCLGLYLRERRAGTPEAMTLHGAGGAREIEVKDAGSIAVNMGKPEFTPALIPFDAPRAARAYELELAGENIPIGAVSLGNPHAVYYVDAVRAAPVARLGPAIARHRRFPRGANAGFMEIADRAHIRLRVFERGAGETQACGSGACAAVAVGIMRGDLDDRVRVTMGGGELMVKFHSGSGVFWMTGPAAFVFDGEIRL